MRLTQMQDIGGCRAVLDGIKQVDELVDKLARDYVFQGIARDDVFDHALPTGRVSVANKTDYIANPKSDGGVHFIMDYQHPSLDHAHFWGSTIEVQVRSSIQHAWATAVEVCQTFTGQALKARVKNAEAEWLRFFALMSSELASVEGRPLVPMTPLNAHDRTDEIRTIVAEKNILGLLQGWNSLLLQTESFSVPNAALYLLELNANGGKLSTRGFKTSESALAHAEYQDRERATENDPSIQVVLVSSDSVWMLKGAYPNYYLDTTTFIEMIKQAIA